MVVRSLVSERLVWSLGSVPGFPVPQRLLERGQVQVAAGALPELAARRAVEPLDAAIELGTAGRQHVEGDLPGRTGGLEVGHELRPAIDLDRLDWHRHSRPFSTG